MKTVIEIDQIRFYAYHGVLEQERTVGNHFSVSVVLEADLTAATTSDNLTHTISYADVYAHIAEEMAIPSQLLEHVAGRIFRRLHAAFPSISHLEVKVYKYNPPGCGETKRAGVVVID